MTASPCLQQLLELTDAGRWQDAADIATALLADCTDWQHRLPVAAALRNWTQVLAIASESGTDPTSFPPGLAQSHVKALAALGYLREGADTARQQAERFPKQSQFSRIHAECLEKAGDTEAAQGVLKAAWALGQRGVLAPLLGLMLRKGAVNDAVQLLQQAGKITDVSPQQHAHAQLQIANTRSDEVAARAAMDRLIALQPEAPGRNALLRSQHAYRYTRPAEQERAWQALLGWLESRKCHADKVDHGALILRNQWRFSSDKLPLIPVLETLENTLLPPSAALVLREVLTQSGEFSRAAALLERSLKIFPAAVPLWRETLRLHAKMGDAKACARLRGQIHKALPEQAAWDAICHNHPGAWAAADMARMIRHGYSTPVYRVAEMFKSDLQRVPRLDASAREALEQVAGEIDAVDALGLAFLTSRHRQLELWDQSTHSTVSYHAFLEAREQLESAIREERGRIAAGDTAEARRNPGRRLILDALSALPADAKDIPDFWRPNTAEALADAVDLACWIIGRLKARIPTALIRLGPGEGHFLPVPRHLHARRAEDQRTMLEWWWNTDWPDSGKERRVRAQFRRAVSRADMLGVVPESRIVRISQTPGKLLISHRGHARVHGYIASRLLAGQGVTSCLFQRDFANWGLWHEVLQAIPGRRICWIAPHDIREYVETHFNLSTEEQILIPGEAKYAGLFNRQTAFEGSLISNHDDILCRLGRARQGQVWLIAAGFLGKIYCDRVARRGAIALDVGSLVDDWMGYATRAGQSDPQPVQNLRSRRITDLPAAL